MTELPTEIDYCDAGFPLTAGSCPECGAKPHELCREFWGRNDIDGTVINLFRSVDR